jgi:hypothetical protein
VLPHLRSNRNQINTTHVLRKKSVSAEGKRTRSPESKGGAADEIKKICRLKSNNLGFVLLDRLPGRNCHTSCSNKSLPLQNIWGVKSARDLVKHLGVRKIISQYSISSSQHRPLSSSIIFRKVRSGWRFLSLEPRIARGSK